MPIIRLVTAKDIASLTVYNSSLTKRRLGRNNDGGYCVLDGISYCSFLSGGIHDDNSFELAALDAYPYLTCNAYDPAGDFSGKSHPRYRFHYGPVGHLGLADAVSALVKLDIEGGEWAWLSKLADAELKNISQLVMELHEPTGNLWDWSQLARIARTHALVHLHANNWAGRDAIVDVGGFRMPACLEATWVRRDLAGPLTLNTEPLPKRIDQPNIPSNPDPVINWWPFVGGSAK